MKNLIRHVEKRIEKLKRNKMEFENAERIDELNSLLRWMNQK